MLRISFTLRSPSYWLDAQARQFRPLNPLIHQLLQNRQP